MTDINISKRNNRSRRHARGRAKLAGTAERPRVTVFKSNTHVYAQAIDDVTGKTLAAVNDAHVAKKGTKTERATIAGTKLAKMLQEQKITTVIFDKAGFTYHGRIKAVAEALRAAGITV
jgi:large subunit ribosomal protein L18